MKKKICLLFVLCFFCLFADSNSKYRVFIKEHATEECVEVILDSEKQIIKNCVKKLETETRNYFIKMRIDYIVIVEIDNQFYEYKVCGDYFALATENFAVKATRELEELITKYFEK